MASVTCLGGFREVGRLAALIQLGSERFLCDYGLNVQDMGVPQPPRLPLTAAFLTHPHLDHSGVMPELYKRGYLGSVVATPACLDLALLLLTDSLNVQGKRNLPSSFLPHDIDKMAGLARPVGFGRPVQFRETTATLHDAGHVPGSAAVLLEGEQRVMFTGDINFMDTAIMRPAAIPKGVDVLLTESTYSTKDHPDRGALGKELRDYIMEVVARHGVAILPCFAVGRTQEMLMLVGDLGVDVTLDGMGIEATRICLQHREAIRDPARLREAFGRAEKVRNPFQRRKIARKPGVIITTAGMLNGGPVSFYLKKLHHDERCALVMNGFQVEGTVGRHLQETGRYVYEGLDVKPKLDVRFMDFSAHAGKTQLLEFFRQLRPGKIVLMHGDRTPEFAEELNGMGYDAVAPANGEKVEL